MHPCTCICIFTLLFACAFGALFFWLMVQYQSLLERLDVTEQYLFGSIETDLRMMKTDQTLASMLQEMEQIQRELKQEILTIWRVIHLLQREIVNLSAS